MAAKTVGLWILRLGLALLFGWAGLVKVWDFGAGASATPGFYKDIINYQLVPSDVAIVMALYLPWLEIFAAAGVLVRPVRLGALLSLGALLVVFLGAVGSAWQRGLDISCGCFGKAVVAANYPLEIGRDLALLVVVVVLWRAESRDERASGHR